MNFFNKIGFIGFGNMGQALAKGLINYGDFPANNIFATAKHYEKLQNNANRLGVHPCKDINEMLQVVDTVVIAIKPYLIKDVLGDYVELFKDKLVISLAANFPYEEYRSFLDNKTKVICTIPNTPVSIGEGIIICEDKTNLAAEDIEKFKKLFNKIALIQFLPTNQIPVAGVVAGCGPAFAAMFIEALGDAGVMEGLSRETAYALASKMLLGTAGLQLMEGTHPGVMKDQVCSPKGTTIQGVRTLEKLGFRSSVIEAVAHICKK